MPTPAFPGRPPTAAQGAPGAVEGRHPRAFCALLLSIAIWFGVMSSIGSVSLAGAEPRVTQDAAAAHEGGSGEAEAEGGWSKTIAKAVNFVVLVGLLAYFLKTPLADHLRGRHETIRRGLTDAAALKTSAEAQLAEVRARLSALPAELESLRRRGQQDLADERVRLAETTTREGQRIIDRTRREIDIQVRVARRQLLEHAADAAMRLARARIERDITPADQVRLIDKYAAEVRA